MPLEPQTLPTHPESTSSTFPAVSDVNAEPTPVVPTDEAVGSSPPAGGSDPAGPSHSQTPSDSQSTERTSSADATTEQRSEQGADASGDQGTEQRTQPVAEEPADQGAGTADVVSSDGSDGSAWPGPDSEPLTRHAWSAPVAGADADAPRPDFVDGDSSEGSPTPTVAQGPLSAQIDGSSTVDAEPASTTGDGQSDVDGPTDVGQSTEEGSQETADDDPAAVDEAGDPIAGAEQQPPASASSDPGQDNGSSTPVDPPREPVGDEVPSAAPAPEATLSSEPSADSPGVVEGSAEASPSTPKRYMPPPYFRGSSADVFGAAGHLVSFLSGDQKDPSTLLDSSALDVLRRDAANPDSGLSPKALGDLVDQVNKLSWSRSAADMPDLGDHRKLLDGGLDLTVGKGADRRNVHIELEMTQHDRENARTTLTAGDLAALGRGDREWADHDAKGEVERSYGRTSRAGASGAAPLITGSGLAGGLKIGGTLSGSSGKTTVGSANVNLSAVRSARGDGDMLSFTVPSKLLVTVSDPARTGAADPPVVINGSSIVDFPLEEAQPVDSPRKNSSGETIASWDAPKKVLRERDLLAGSTAAATSVDVAPIRKGVLTSLDQMGLGNEAVRDQVRSLISEHEMLRFNESLSGGHTSQDITLPNGAKATVTVKSKATSARFEDVSSHTIEAQRKAQLNVAETNVRSGSATTGLSFSFLQGLLNLKLPTYNTGASRAVTEVRISYPKNKIETTGDTRRYQVKFEHEVTIRSSSGEFPGVRGADAGASADGDTRRDVTGDRGRLSFKTDGEGFVQVPEAQVADFESKLAGASRPEGRAFGLPTSAAPSPTGDPKPPRALQQNKGMGGAILDQLEGADRVMDHIQQRLESLYFGDGSLTAQARRRAFDLHTDAIRQVEALLGPGALRTAAEPLFGRGLVAPIDVPGRLGSSRVHIRVTASRPEGPDGLRYVGTTPKNMKLTHSAEQWNPQLHGGSGNSSFSGSVSSSLESIYGSVEMGGSWNRENGYTGGRWTGEDRNFTFDTSVHSFDSDITYKVEFVDNLGRRIGESHTVDGGRARFQVPDGLTGPTETPASAAGDSALPRLGEPRFGEVVPGDQLKNYPSFNQKDAPSIKVDRLTDHHLSVLGSEQLLNNTEQLLGKLAVDPTLEQDIKLLLENTLRTDVLTSDFDTFLSPDGRVLNLPRSPGILADRAIQLRFKAVLVESTTESRNVGKAESQFESQDWTFAEARTRQGKQYGATYSTTTTEGGPAQGHDIAAGDKLTWGQSKKWDSQTPVLNLDRTGTRVTTTAEYKRDSYHLRWTIEATSVDKNLLGTWNPKVESVEFGIGDGAEILRPASNLTSPKPTGVPQQLPAAQVPLAARTVAFVDDNGNNGVVADAVEKWLQDNHPKLLDRDRPKSVRPVPEGGDGGQPPRPAKRVLPAAVRNRLQLSELAKMAPDLDSNGLLVALPNKGGLGYLRSGYLQIKTVPVDDGPFEYQKTDPNADLKRHDLRIERTGTRDATGVDRNTGAGASPAETGGGGDGIASRIDGGGGATASTKASQGTERETARVEGLYPAFEHDKAGGVHTYTGKTKIQVEFIPNTRLSPLARALGAERLHNFIRHGWGRSTVAISRGVAPSGSTKNRFEPVELNRQIVVPDAIARQALTATPKPVTTVTTEITGNAPPKYLDLPADRVAGTGVATVGLRGASLRGVADGLLGQVQGLPGVENSAKDVLIRRLASTDGAPFAALLDATSDASVSSFLDKALVGTHDRPLGTRSGAYFATYGDLQMSVRPYDATKAGWTDGNEVRLPIFVDEDVQQQSQNRSHDGSLAGQTTAEVDVGEPGANMGTEIASGITERQVLAHGRIRLRTHGGAFMLVDTGLQFDFNVNASEGPWKAKHQARFYAPQSAQFAISPDLARTLGIDSPEGWMTRSGWQLPTVADTDASFENAQRVPKVDGWSIVHGRFDGTGLDLRGESQTAPGLRDLLNKTPRHNRPIALAVTGDETRLLPAYAAELATETDRRVVYPTGPAPADHAPPADAHPAEYRPAASSWNVIEPGKAPVALDGRDLVQVLKSLDPPKAEEGDGRSEGGVPPQGRRRGGPPREVRVLPTITEGVEFGGERPEMVDNPHFVRMVDNPHFVPMADSGYLADSEASSDSHRSDDSDGGSDSDSDGDSDGGDSGSDGGDSGELPVVPDSDS